MRDPAFLLAGKGLVIDVGVADEDAGQGLILHPWGCLFEIFDDYYPLSDLREKSPDYRTGASGHIQRN